MLRYLTQAEFHNHPKLIDTMFKHRADQFKGRLDWDVTVDHMGYERDQYDTPAALYGIWEMPDGSHGASMRMLTTTGPVMVNDYFHHISGCHFQSAQIWESTRFCMSPDIKSNQHQLSAAIMLSGCEVGMNFGLRKAVAVFDPRIMRIYRQIGWPPDVLGKQGRGKDAIWVGTWEFSEAIRRKICKRAAVAPELSRYWFDRSMRHHLQIAA